MENQQVQTGGRAEQSSAVFPKICLSVNEAAELTGLSRATLYRAMASGELAYSQIGTRRRFLPEHLHGYLKAFEKNRK